MSTNADCHEVASLTRRSRLRKSALSSFTHSKSDSSCSPVWPSLRECFRLSLNPRTAEIELFLPTGLQLGRFGQIARIVKAEVGVLGVVEAELVE